MLLSSRLRTAVNEEKTGVFANSGSKQTSVNSANNDSAGTKSKSIDFDASLSNPIYGNSSTVTPKSLTTSLLIKY